MQTKPTECMRTTSIAPQGPRKVGRYELRIENIPRENRKDRIGIGETGKREIFNSGSKTTGILHVYW